jgi:hypothetical protein
MSRVKEWKDALDTPINGIFGIIVAFWSVFFVESWKRK